jgi:hypothetical protein
MASNASRKEIEGLYREILGRKADPSGLEEYTGKNIRVVRRVLEKSDEAKARKAGGAGTAGSKAVEAAGKPSWVSPQDEKFKWSEKDARGAAAFQTILGREMSPGDLAEFRKTNLSLDRIQAHWAASDEARKRGIRPGDYGVKEADPPAGDPYFDAWRRANPGRSFYDTDAEALEWQRRATKGDVSGYEATLAGEIQERSGYNPESGSVYTGKLVTPDAVKRMGGRVVYAGNRAGDIFWVPEGTGFASGKTVKDYGSSDGYTTYGAKGNPKKGVYSVADRAMKDVGMGRDLRNTISAVAAVYLAPVTAGASLSAAAPLLVETLGIKEGYTITDPLNLTSGTMHGSEGYEQNVAGGASLTGLREDEVGRAQGYTKAAIKFALTATGVGSIAALAMEGMDQASRAQAGYQSWGDAGVNFGVQAALSALGGSNIYVNAAMSGAAAGGLEAYRGGSFSEALESAGWAAGGTLAAGKVNDAAANFLGASATTNAMSSAATTAFMQTLQGQEVDWGSVGFSAAQGAVQGAKQAKYEDGLKQPLSYRDRMNRTFWRQDGKGLPGGSVRPNSADWFPKGKTRGAAPVAEPVDYLPRYDAPGNDPFMGTGSLVPRHGTFDQAPLLP